MKNLLLVAHTPSENTLAIAKALFDGAKNTRDTLSARLAAPNEIGVKDIQNSHGLLLLTTENFGYMSGLTKDLFDRTYNDLLETKQGLPCAVIIRAGKDGTGTERAISAIFKGLGWKHALEPLVLQGTYEKSFLDLSKEYGETFANGLDMGIF